MKYIKTPNGIKPVYEENEEELNKIFGLTRTAARFMGSDKNMPVLLQKGDWVINYFNIRSYDCSDYALYRKSDLDKCKPHDRLPLIEFRCKNHTLKFKCFLPEVIVENIPQEALDLIKEFCDNYQTTDTKPIPVKYLKLYIAVLDEVNDGMVPTLVAHSILGAHLKFALESWQDSFENNVEDIYSKWLNESFRKCVVRVNRKEFEKIKQLDKVYLGHENTTLGGEKSCAISYPVWSNDTPNVLKFAKLWSPKCQN